MGGLIFVAADGVVTPRMVPEVYHAMRDRCQEKLRELFEVVETPIEAPEKTSFGDVDILVASKRTDAIPLSDNAKDAICRALGAITWKSTHDNTISVAIPWPEDFPYVVAQTQDESPAHEHTSQCALCIQVDVHICKTMGQLQWLLFKQSHGDTWVILGSMLRSAGLTLDEVGLHIRIPELENFNKRQARVLLSDDQSKILSFLGLDEKPLEKQFPSQDDLFEYIAKCRLLGPIDDNPDQDKFETGSGGSKFKTNERKRPMFRKWFNEYIPAHPFSTSRPSRETVRQEAFAHFPGTQSTYDTRLKTWRIKRQRETLYNDVIKPLVPVDLKDIRRGCCSSALKKIILEGDSSFDGIVAPTHLKDEDGLFNEDAVRAWVKENCQRVSDAAWEVNQKRYAAHKALKESASKTEESEAT